MTPGEIATLAGVIGSGLGALTTYAFLAGGKNAKLKDLVEGHTSLKKEFILHKDNRVIHIDPERDGQAEEDLRKAIAEGFKGVNSRLDRIDARCEARGADCVRHFASVERRIAASTGKANGD